MKRKLLAVAVASLFALPAFAVDRDEPYDDANRAASASASASQPRDALVPATASASFNPVVVFGHKGTTWFPEYRKASGDSRRNGASRFSAYGSSQF